MNTLWCVFRRAKSGGVDTVPGHETPVPEEVREKVLDICFLSIVRLGDLSRWREYRRTGSETQDWRAAMGFYDLATVINPDSGYPHNQLAVLASSSKQDPLKIIYHYYRSLTSKQPHEGAQNNLDLEFERIMSSFNPDLDDSGLGQKLLGGLASRIVTLHGTCLKGAQLSKQNNIESRTMHELVECLKVWPMSVMLRRIVIVNLAAEYQSAAHLGSKLPYGLQPLTTDMHQESPTDTSLSTTKYNLLMTNVATLRNLLRLLNQDTITHLANLQWTRIVPVNRVTQLMKPILPALRLYSNWLLYSLPALTRYYESGEFFTELCKDIRGLWLSYTIALNTLIRFFPDSDLVVVDYLLEEDEDTIGFMPFTAPDLRHRYFHPNGTKKPKGSLVRRMLPNQEMLARIKDLIADAMLLAEPGRSPMRVGYTSSQQPMFVYQPSPQFEEWRPSSNHNSNTITDGHPEPIPYQHTLFESSEPDVTPRTPPTRTFDDELDNPFFP